MSILVFRWFNIKRFELFVKQINCFINHLSHKTRSLFGRTGDKIKYPQTKGFNCHFVNLFIYLMPFRALPILNTVMPLAYKTPVVRGHVFPVETQDDA